MIAFAALLIAFLPASASPATNSDSSAYWLFIDSAWLHSSHAPISDRAVERRARRGAIIHDRDINPEVVLDLKNRGFRIRTTSRMLGAVSVDVARHDESILRELPYVREVLTVRRIGSPPEPIEEAAADVVASKFTSTIDAGLSEPFLRMINAHEPLGEGINGRGVLLGFLDTEYGDFQHPAFARHRDEGRILGVVNFTGRPQSSRHGLMVASVAAGRDDGMLLGPAHGATLLGAVTEYSPTETREEEDFLVAGLEYLEAQGVDVVNISLGYTDFDDDPGYSIADLDGETAVTTRAVQAAADRGVVVVVSAGNSGCSSPQSCWYYIGTPADARGAIAVGAVEPDSSKAGFSSFGPTADGRIKPDVAAPGVRVPAAIGGGAYALVAGTSFAAPLVSGVAAQMLQVNPDLDPEEASHILRSTAHQAYAPGNALGWGIINAAAAVAEARLRRDQPAVGTLALAAPYPNPVSGQAQVGVDVPEAGFHGSIALYDVLGRLVLRLHDGTLGPGSHSFTIAASSMANGVYLVVASGQGRHQSRSVVVAR